MKKLFILCCLVAIGCGNSKVEKKQPVVKKDAKVTKDATKVKTTKDATKVKVVKDATKVKVAKDATAIKPKVNKKPMKK